MSSQETLISEKRKKRGPAPTGQGTPVLLRLHPIDLNAVDDWRAAQPDIPGRPEAIRRLVRRGLSES